MYLGASVDVDPDWWRAGRDFAERSIASRRSKIAARGQRVVDKVLNDIAMGVVAEYAVRAYLNDRGIDCSAPDLEVYQAKQKSWAPDLTAFVGKTDHAVDLHVKTWSDPKWGSWVFQYGAHGWDCDPLLQGMHPDHYLVLTHIASQDEVVVDWMIHQPDVDGLWEEPILPQLRRSKRILYPTTLDSQLLNRYRTEEPPQWLQNLNQ